MNQISRVLDSLFTRKRWMIHVMFWLVVLVFYVAFFGRKNSNYLQTFFFVGLLMPITISTTYVLNYYLVPTFLLRERFALFALYFFYTLVISIFFEMMIALITLMVMAELNIRDMSPASIDLFFLLASLLMVVFFAMGIKMLLHWKQSKEDYQKLMRDKIETELRFLKVQLNPHFLFNTLNNLYYLTTEKSNRAPQAILQLSEILDYVLHQGKAMLVPLESELKQVDNYIALELLRYEDRIQIDKTIEGDINEMQIGPMMLITLVENSFKHGVMKTAGKAWIKMSVDCSTQATTIQISNSGRPVKQGTGIGLSNLRSQLDHLYPEKYSLQIDSDRADQFSVRLVLNS